MRERFLRHRVVAILRDVDPVHVPDLYRALHAAGVRILEVTMNTPGAPRMISLLAGLAGEEVLVGAGTVLSAQDARQARDAGARFAVMPHTDPALLAELARLDLPAVPGAMTPSEIVRAWQEGALLVKVFPARTLGPGYFRELRGPLRDIPLLATGGITPENAGEFLAAGADALGVGSSVVSRDLLRAGRCEEIRERARRLLAAVAPS